MTDKEIIKALECCYVAIEKCRECPYDKYTSGEGCFRTMYIDTINLINRLQAENERLQTENLILSQKRANIFEIINAVERGRIRGIKEFAERLKEETNKVYYVESIALLNVHEIINNLVKEMVGEE